MRLSLLPNERGNNKTERGKTEHKPPDGVRGSLVGWYHYVGPQALLLAWIPSRLRRV